jgi:2-amino-4-hydroxy-6-hydroxymethyldihydropteridine diphosphokinase
LARAFIGTGSNLGNREENLKQAQAKLAAVSGIQILKSSKVYETDPVGGPPQGKYLNAVWEVETGLEPEALMKALLSIEIQMGRARAEKNGPRPIDLDILFYGNEIIDRPGLKIPHPRLQERGFVLKPLMDLAPGFVHPVLKKTISVIASEAKQSKL